MKRGSASRPPEEAISADLRDNMARIAEAFADCDDIAIESWNYGPQQQFSACSVYCRSFIEDSANHYMKSTLQDMVDHEVGMAETVTPELIFDFINRRSAASQPTMRLERMDEAIGRVLEGCVVLFVDRLAQAIAYEAGNIPKRQVTEPVNEPGVQGPREGTIENLSINLGMLRLRVKSPRFKIRMFTAGTEMRTKIAYAYLDQVVDPDTLARFQSRLRGIERYEVPETSYVEEWIEDSVYSPFPQYRYTERTDSAAAALLDGKILVLVDNSPMILICPALFVDFFGASEDYYIRTVIATLIRFLRLLAFFIALTLPSIYIALSTFHPELVPTVLLLAILDTREGIPFPAFFEALVMEISFELLREAGIRLPRPVGSAVSIVGALVIGQAAISAKIASPIMVIVVALTGIASFAIPHYEMGIALRIIRFPLMIAAALLGGFGIMIVSLLTLLHLTSLHTLGQPYLTSLAPLKARDLRDVFVRIPLKSMLRSPRNRRLHGQKRTNP
ncbi:spore germination protein [Paenibacillaceae bacterium WGS1546]|uniref:spore germination protein n=1 Tax=Cohnella sp. WGS1546 TaxID=3366810 RepID=UPI00372D07FB